MKNCLITKLKGTVDNSSLLKLGEVLTTIDSVSSPTLLNLYPVTGKTLTISADTNCLSINNGVSYTNEVVISDNTECYVNNADAVNLKIYPKYDILKAGKWNDEDNASTVIKNIDIFAYSTNIVEIKLRNSNTDNGDIKNIKKCINLTSLEVNDGCTCNLSDLAGFTVLRHLTLPKNSYGNLSVLANIPTLIEINNCFGNSRITGSIEEFVSIRRAAGQTTGQISGGYLFANCPNITFNGNPMGNNDSNKLTWDATTITISGTTIVA